VSTDGDDGDSGPGTREVAYRLFAAEFDDCDFQFSESDEERAPNFVITPTGGRVNRLFLVGVLTELEQVNESMLRARIVDPTGAFVVYAGQYQPEALSFLERTDPPAFLAVTGKARTYQPDDTDVVYSSVRPESISEVDAGTRDRWVVATAEQTLDRVGTMAAAIERGLSGVRLREHLESEGVDPALAQGVTLARDHYGTTPAYLGALRDLALDATRVVADERDEAGTLDLAPDEGGPADLDALQAAGPAVAGTADGSAGATTAGGTAEAATEDVSAEATTGTEDTGAEPTGAAESPSTTTDVSSAVDSDASTESTTGTTSEAAGAAESAAEAPTTGEPSEPATAEASGEVGGTTAETAAAPTEGSGDDLGEFEPGEFDEDPEADPLGDDVREQVEEEYGTEFSTGTEVEPEPDLEPEAEEADETAGSGGETEPEPAESAGAVDEGDEPADEDVDLSEAVMDAMQALDEGDGAPTDAVVERVVDRTGATPDAVDGAVQDALMGGQCYEPEDGRLKPI
jgi:RPA family protein